MTGELTLRGKVLPIGGLKEKLLAAARAGITTALIPAANAPELSEIPAHVTAKLTVKPVRTMDEILETALAGSLAAMKKVGAHGRRAPGATAQADDASRDRLTRKPRERASPTRRALSRSCSGRRSHRRYCPQDTASRRRGRTS